MTGYTLDFFDPTFQADPFPVYAEMRRAGPLCTVEPMGFVGVTRYRDVEQVLGDPEHFSSTGFESIFKPDWLSRNPGAYSMLSMDPPRHTALRKLVHKAFVPRVLAPLERSVRRLVGQLLDGSIARGTLEVVADLAEPLSGGSIALLLGVDSALGGRFNRWAAALASVTPSPIDDDHAETVRAAVTGMERFFDDEIRARHAEPGDDLISVLLRAEIDGHLLSAEQLMSFLFLLLVAGTETTTHLIAKSVLMLADRPDLAQRLRSAPDEMPAFIDEMLRYDPPTHAVFRLARGGAAVAGHELPAGTVVMVLLASANRDPDRFDDPDAFDVARSAATHIAFGHGPHTCIGSAVARLEARLALSALLERVSRLTRLDAELAWKHTLTVRGLTRLAIGLESPCLRQTAAGRGERRVR